ncbi:hypothetical protein JCM19301_3191 [Jejuia pallidilutea]|uniref:Uncharacterized protein n=1 Tax=Jejuia pallidilutea TaxID=504487 RepID=A0A090VRS0_9FLAO|nr:hypothetical protein JCM19301_3191 [Jejuia pallidilutea]
MDGLDLTNGEKEKSKKPSFIISMLCTSWRAVKNTVKN